MSQAELAGAANLGLSTVKNFEAGRRLPIANNLDAMHRALEARGVQFIAKKDKKTGVRMATPRGAHK